MRSVAQSKVLLSLCLLLTCKAQHYQVQDNEEYIPFGSRSAQNNQQLEYEGFVKPIDFTNLFAVSNEDLTNDQSIPKDFFQSTSSSINPFSLPLPSNTNSFSSDVELLPNAQHNNSAGFTHPEVKFQSLFDISGSASEVGFRPQDFLKSEKSDKENDASSPSYEFQSFIPNFEKQGSYSPVSASAPAYNTDGSSHPTKQSQGTQNHSYKPKYKETISDKSLPPSKEAPGKSNYQYVPEKHNYHGTSYLNALSSTDQKDKTYSSAPSTDHYSGTLGYNPVVPGVIQGGKKSSPQAVSPSYSPAPANSYKSVIPAGKQENLYASVPSSDYYFGSNAYNLPSNVHQDSKQQSAAAPNYIPATTRNFNQYSNPVQQIASSLYNPISSTATPNSFLKSADQGNAHASIQQGSPTFKHGGSFSAYQNEPYVKQESEGVQKSSQANKDKKCRKVDKHLTSDDIVNGRFKRDAMTCYICEDPKTKVNYEKCSYETEPQATNYFKGHTQSYKIDHAHTPEGFRFRRDIHDILFDIKKDFVTSANNFYPRRIRQESGTSYEYPYSYTGSSYKYGPDYFKDFEEIEKQSAASSVIPDEKNCKKVQKESMTCYECVNPKTKGNYEQCSYSSDPKKSNYFVAHQTSYNSNNQKQPQEGSRHRRDEEDKLSNHGEQQKEAASKNKESKSYVFPSLYSPSTDDKNSEKYKRLDAYPNGKSDTYIYGSDKKPEGSEKSDSYYYNTDKKPEGSDKSDSYYYNYDKKPNEDQKSYYYNNDKKTDGSEKSDSYYYPSKSYDEYFRSLFPELDEINKASATSDNEKHDKAPNPGYYLSQSSDTKDQPEYKIKSEYYPPQPSEAKNVPDFETKSVIPRTFFTNNEEKKDLHKILGEFSNKDWSDCKKVQKDKMTCYQCTDKKGLQHEECMFVAASEPKNEHLAYHEVKEFRLVPSGKENQTADESKVTEFLSSPDSSPTQYDKTKRKTFFKKVTSTASPSADTKYLDSQKVQIIKEKAQSKGAPGVAVKVTRRSSQSISTTKTTMISTPKPLASNIKKLKVTKRRIPSTDMLQSASEVEERQEESPRKSKSSSKELPTEPELSEHDRSPDGYYSAETRLKFDPILQVTLPEYMLSRSEHEAIFDEVMASGR